MCYKLSRNWTVSRTLIISWFLSVTPEQVKRTLTVDEISETVLVKGVLIVPWITLRLWSCDALFHSALLLTLTVINLLASSNRWKWTSESKCEVRGYPVAQWGSGSDLELPHVAHRQYMLCVYHLFYPPPYQNISPKSIHSEPWFCC